MLAEPTAGLLRGNGSRSAGDEHTAADLRPLHSGWFSTPRFSGHFVAPYSANDGLRESAKAEHVPPSGIVPGEQTRVAGRSEGGGSPAPLRIGRECDRFH